MSNREEIALPENLTIAKIQAFHETLEAMVDNSSCDEYLMQSNAVSRVDTSGVQLLYAFVLAAHERKIKVTWDEPSDTLMTAVTTLGVKDALGIH